VRDGANNTHLRGLSLAALVLRTVGWAHALDVRRAYLEVVGGGIPVLVRRRRNKYCERRVPYYYRTTRTSLLGCNSVSTNECRKGVDLFWIFRRNTKRMERADFSRENSPGEFVNLLEMDVHNGTEKPAHTAVSMERGYDTHGPTGKEDLLQQTTPGSTASTFKASFHAVSDFLDQTVAVLDVEEREKLEMEIEGIPYDEKKEYLDALRFASAFVLEKEANPAMFVLMENHQYDRAARRMIDYWKNRTSMFRDRAYRSVFDLSGNGALTLEELEPFHRSLEHVILPSDAMGRAVLYFDDEFLDSRYYRDAYGDTRQRILFLLLNFIALTNMPISQMTGFVTIRVIRRENYDLTKAVKHGSILSFMPLISHSIHFCGVPPKGARRYFKDYLVPLLIGSSENESDRPKEKMSNALAPFPILSKFHMSSKRQSIAEKLEEYDFCRTGIPVSLGGKWSNASTGSRFNETIFVDSLRDTKQMNMLSVWSLIIRMVLSGASQDANVSDDDGSEDSKVRDYKMKVNEEKIHDSTLLTSIPFSGDQAILQSEQECKPTRASCFGFTLLSKEANEAIVQQRKRRKRQMDVIYARHRRSRDRCEVFILQERITFFSRSNRDLNRENSALEKLLSDARAIVARFELESSIWNSRMLKNSYTPGNASLLVSEKNLLRNSLMGRNVRDAAVSASNFSMCSFPMSNLYGNLASLAPVHRVFLSCPHPSISGDSFSECLVQHLLEQAQNDVLTQNDETMHILQHGLLLAQRSNRSAINVATVDRLLGDSHVLSPALIQCQPPAPLLSQALGRQPFLPEVNFERPTLMVENSNDMSTRVYEELLEQIRFLAAHRHV
jgi:hypothetical protein